MTSSCFLAKTYLSWLPAWSGWGWMGILLACLLVWVGLRLFWGRSLVHGRIGLWLLRGAALTILVAILMGPTRIDEQLGAVTRPTTLFLVDGSQSMQLGQEESRWQASLRFLDEARIEAGPKHDRHCQSLRFGHRLGPLKSEPDPPADSTTLTSVSTDNAETAGIDPPDASDSRLGDALRQLLPQVSAKSSAGVVLLSDGRVRASESVEQLAEVFGRSGVPLHVVPVGQSTGTGDIAVVSLVVPPRVRKYTENELQVFLRSFGYTGERTTVRVLSRNRIAGDNSAALASVPITLTGGAQSASLTFRVDEQPDELVVVVDPVVGEMTQRNNRLQTRVDIDRTKVRVLYVESDATAIQQRSYLGRILSLGGAASGSADRADALTVQAALQADEDIECTVLVSFGGGPPQALDTSDQISSGGFPKTRAELFAYDCVVFSNVGPSVLDEQQNAWLAQWIEGRGGGLVVTGSDALKLADWEDSPLLSLLPISLEQSQAMAPQPQQVDAVMPRHPIWRLRMEQRLNGELLAKLPPLTVAAASHRAKPAAEVLARQGDTGEAVLAAQRAGRGRVLVSTAALGGRWLAELADNWGPQPERAAGKLWRNLVYWATEGSSTGRRRLVAQSDKRFYRPGQPLSIVATAYNEAAQPTEDYQVWAMFEPASLDDMSLYSPVLWPDNVVRESGEVGPRIAWGEELPLSKDPNGGGYRLDLMLSESGSAGDHEMRVEMTAYEGGESAFAYGHGTQVDSTSLGLQILSDPFEQQNPLPNHELLTRIASVSGGQVLNDPSQLAELLISRPETRGPPHRDLSPAWSQWWMWLALVGLLTTEWVWRRVTGLA